MNDEMVTLLEVTAIPPKYIKVTSSSGSGTSFYATNCLAVNKKLNSGTTTETVEYLKKPIPRQMHGVYLNLRDLTGGVNGIHTNTAWFEGDPQYSIGSGDDKIDGSLVGDMTACDMLSNVINMWEIPKKFISYVVNGVYSPLTDVITGMIGIASTNLISGTFKYTPVVKVYNNKARYGQSVRITVFSPCSGAKIEKEIYKTLPLGSDPSSEEYDMPYTISADVRPEGSPVFCWNYNDGGTSQLSLMCEHIRGGTWKKVTIVAQGTQGSYFDKLTIQQQKEQLALKAGLAVGAGVLAVATGGIGAIAGGSLLATDYGIGRAIASGFDNIATMNGGAFEQPMAQWRNSGLKTMGYGSLAIGGGIASYVMGSYAQKQQQELLEAKGITASTVLQVGNSDFARDVGLNYFYSCISSYSAGDMVNFDAFLTRYGYNVGNMIIGTQHFYCRKKFVYIKINEIVISSTHAGSHLINKVKEQLKAGVRIWRVAPNVDDMNPSGNREDI